MKPFVQKLPLTEETSFVARTYRTPAFEVSWHQHIEYELILFTEGKGTGFIGNYIGEFETGDIFFLGANLPHTFQKRHKDLITSAVVIQFREDFWGKDFMTLPESKEIQQLFQVSMQGLKIEGQSKLLLQPLIRDLESASGFSRIIKLCDCLQIIARSQEFIPLSTQEVKAYNPKDKERIEKVFHYTIESFAKPVTLTEIAELINMSVPAFCNYFKKSTKRTYIDFLNEVRIGHACRLLTDTERTILEICFESGFNTLANFNKQFLKVKKMTPSRYRKYFSN
jgi:AraC-like DNA-binding protein